MSKWTVRYRIFSGIAGTFVLLFLCHGVLEAARGAWAQALVSFGVALVQVQNIWHPEIIANLKFNVPIGELSDRVRKQSRNAERNPVLIGAAIVGFAIGSLGIIPEIVRAF